MEHMQSCLPTTIEPSIMSHSASKLDDNVHIRKML